MRRPSNLARLSTACGTDSSSYSRLTHVVRRWVQLSHAALVDEGNVQRTLRRLHSQQFRVPLRTNLRFRGGSDILLLKACREEHLECHGHGSCFSETTLSKCRAFARIRPTCCTVTSHNQKTNLKMTIFTTQTITIYMEFTSLPQGFPLQAFSKKPSASLNL